jgi:hypothetical protein
LLDLYLSLRKHSSSKKHHEFNETIIVHLKFKYLPIFFFLLESASEWFKEKRMGEIYFGGTSWLGLNIRRFAFFTLRQNLTNFS